MVKVLESEEHKVKLKGDRASKLTNLGITSETRTSRERVGRKKRAA